MNITYISKNLNRALLLTAFFVALFTTTHVAYATDVNLALNKHATQSSNYHGQLYHAPMAVNGDNIDGWNDHNFTHTLYEQGAWWQVDLGDIKTINQIIIYNRKDCCQDRLSHYSVSIIDDYNNVVEKQDFNTYPYQKQIIEIQGTQGRYVKVQLLDSNYLSLEEVKVMGSDASEKLGYLRFPEVDYSDAYNQFGGSRNAPNQPNKLTLVAIRPNGTIQSWDTHLDAPTGTNYTKIYSNSRAFAALKSDGTIQSWGDAGAGGEGAPTDAGYVKIYSNNSAFAALKSNGFISVWGNADAGGDSQNMPNDKRYTAITPSIGAFAALRVNGSISVWGDANFGGDSSVHRVRRTLPPHMLEPPVKHYTTAPKDTGYTKIYSNGHAFAALKPDGSIRAWGSILNGGKTEDVPTDTGYIEISSGFTSFAALKSDGSISIWGGIPGGKKNIPAKGYTHIVSNNYGYSALKNDGSIDTWSGLGDNISHLLTKPPADKGYVKIYSNAYAFAALRADGTIKSWGVTKDGTNSWGITKYNDQAPIDKGYVKIYSNAYSFAALKADGTISAWGAGGNPPSDSGYIDIHSNHSTFIASKTDGTVSIWK
ncbi:MAG: discoidin domain-containing protein [Gammaproteobacteria bacterium]|nr:discoidin domain-containing protein [Gammaproteobacteria bacterium]